MGNAVDVQFDKSQMRKLAAVDILAPKLLEPNLQFAFVGITENLSGEMKRRLPVDTGTLVNSITAKVEGRGLDKSGLVFPASPADIYAPVVERRPKNPQTTRSRSPRSGQWQWRDVKKDIAPQVVNRALDVAVKRTVRDIANALLGRQ